MQQFRNTLFILALSFFSTLTFAQEQPCSNASSPMHVTFNMTDSAAPKFSVRVIAAKGKKITMTIYNDQGENIFSKEYSESFQHQVDFSQAGDGYYTVEIYCSRERVCKRIEISTEQRNNRRATIETK